MNDKIKIFSEKTVLKDMIFCNFCDTNTVHCSLFKVHKETIGNEGYGLPIFWSESYVIQCQGCDIISFMTKDWNSEEIEFSSPDDFGGHEVIKYRYYPEHVSLDYQIVNSSTIPKAILDIYKETKSLISKDMFRFAALGQRLLIEELAKAQGAKKYNLGSKIEELSKISIFTKSDIDVFKKLKEFGDNSAHHNKTLTKEILEPSLEIIELVLKKIYVLEERKKKLLEPEKNEEF